MIDSGIDAGHLDLDEGKVIAFVDCTSGACVTAAPFDDHGHGTHVAATIAGDGDGRLDHRYAGVAPEAGLVGIKVLNSTGSGSDSSVIAGIQWAVAHRAELGIGVLSMSLGGGTCANGLEPGSAAVDAAVAAGLPVVVAAGNSGPGSCTVGWPGAAANAITVGAMADLGVNAPLDPLGPFGPGFYQAWFSSRGPTGAPNPRIKPDISAPGIDVTSARAGTTNGYADYDGTRRATPFVSGVVLLMLDANPALTPTEVKQDLMSTAVDWGPAGVDTEYGAGRLDAYAAIAAAGALLPSPPAMPAHVSVSGFLATGETDTYSLPVLTTDFPVGVTLVNTSISTFESANPNFDVYLRGPAPSTAVVAKSEYLTRQDDFGYMPSFTGTYILEVKSKAGSGNYVLDVSFPVLPTVSIADSSVVEGAARTSKYVWASLTLSAPMPVPVGVHWTMADGSATSGQDYSGLGAASGAVTFPPGEVSREVGAQVFGDAQDEPDETFTVTLSQPSNATLDSFAATVTILDDDAPPLVSVRGRRILEGDSGSRIVRFKVVLSAPSDKTVAVRAATANGTAKAPGDYRARARVLEFAPGDGVEYLDVPIRGDLRDEPNEYFRVRLSELVNADPGVASARAVIVDDDP